MNPPMRERVTVYIENLQRRIVNVLQELDHDAPPFDIADWSRDEGGKGRACTFATSSTISILEKAAVNISIIHGNLPPSAVQKMAMKHAPVSYSTDTSSDLPFFAAGISLIIHPRNPNVPSAHANYRYFEIESGTGSEMPPHTWWFGGITDLTPSYLFEDDFRHFHRTLKEACDPYGSALYPAFKQNCDEYFFLKHRDEHRGIGGLRFDDLCDEPHSLLKDVSAPRPQTAQEIFDFIRSLGDAFIPSYIPILSNRFSTGWTLKMRRWQLIRRGRYVEFNLIYDRGTRFGLAVPGVQVENVLASLPEEARWEYMSDLGIEGDGSEESKMVDVLKSPRSWI
ncbi:Coproporphyrinogen oxidase [Armillaria luteobubalina]|uniref:coproporphyrinogen oxidase n=1 Tax=Armillaria luteobubalina TaxID=153913 RepID=A0AA39UZS8_9AGAR|nr:Coproporphyrinogen oxidase [Armillaria luteobubalina]